MSTYYRVLREAGESRERRAQAAHPAAVKPELATTGPNQCWSWDITKLHGPAKWTYYYLYVILDIFSRYAVGWMVATRESAASPRSSSQRRAPPGHHRRAADHTRRPRLLDDLQAGDVPARRPRRHQVPLAAARIQRQPVLRKPIQDAEVPAGLPSPVHLDRGSPRPLQLFFPWYNEDHRHGGLGLHTAADVHYGQATTVQARRADVLTAAYLQHPERFVRKPPAPPELPTASWINAPGKKQAAAQ